MSTLIKLLKLLYPFLQEFGLKEVNLKEFISQNKTLSYMLMICTFLFVMFIYALEQAHLRMLSNSELVKQQIELTATVKDNEDLIEQLEITCEGNRQQTPIIKSENSIENALSSLMGNTDEK